MLQLIEQSAAGSLRDGRVQRPSLGITIDGGGNVMRHLGVRRLPGVLVMGVAPGTPAAEAGVRDTTRDGSGRVVVRTPRPHSFCWRYLCAPLSHALDKPPPSRSEGSTCLAFV